MKEMASRARQDDRYERTMMGRRLTKADSHPLLSIFLLLHGHDERAFGERAAD